MAIETQAPVIATATAPSIDPADVAAHYDDLDPYYRRLWGEHLHHGLFERRGMSVAEATRRLIAVVAEQAGVRPGSEVCDAGCGYGGTARVLGREYGARVTALTISPAQYAHARQVDPEPDADADAETLPTSGRPRYLLRDWLHNGLDAGSFDAVLSIESSEHMPDLAAFFDEAARVLRPGGRLVICAWLTRDHPRAWERRALIDPICREGRLRAMETRACYDEQARRAGLMPRAFADVSRQVKPTWPICARRTLGTLLRDRASRRFLLRDGGPNRIFALTLLRIWLAYELGTMRYGIFTFEK